jgi:hypothetical protein
MIMKNAAADPWTKWSYGSAVDSSAERGLQKYVDLIHYASKLTFWECIRISFGPSGRKEF